MYLNKNLQTYNRLYKKSGIYFHTHTHAHILTHTHTHTHTHTYTHTHTETDTPGQLSIGFRLYGNKTWPIKWNAVSSRLRWCRYCCMDALLGLNSWRRSSTAIIQECCERSWQQHPTRRQLYGHLAPTTKTIQARRTRHAGHCWRSKDEIVRDVLLWTPAYGQSKPGRPARTFIQQLCDDTGCNPEDLPEAMNDRETWRERVRDIHASCTT